MTEIRDELWLYSPTGILQAPGVVITSLAWALEENKFGKLVATGPLNEIDFSLFQEDARFEIHRFMDGAPLGVEGDTQFLLRYWEAGEEDNGAETWKIEAYTPEYLLSGRIVDSYASTDNDTNPLTTKTDNADDLAKALVDENMGPSTPTLAAREIAELTVEADMSLAPSITKGCAWEELYAVLQDIAADASYGGNWLSFGMVKTDSSGSGLTFRTWLDQRGMDHSSGSNDEVIVSKANGNLKNPRVSYDHRTEWTAVRALGKGEGQSRKTVRVEDTARSTASPLAYREKKIESSQATTTATLTAIAQAELQRGRPVKGFSGKFVDTDYARYGLRVRFGDLVTAEYNGESFTCRIYKVSGSYTRGGAENLDISLEGSQYL